MSKGKNATQGVVPAAQKDEPTARTGEQTTKEAEHALKREESREQRDTDKTVNERSEENKHRPISKGETMAREATSDSSAVLKLEGSEKDEQDEGNGINGQLESDVARRRVRNPTTLTFAPDLRERNDPDEVLIVPGPRERREGTSFPSPFLF